MIRRLHLKNFPISLRTRSDTGPCTRRGGARPRESACEAARRRPLALNARRCTNRWRKRRRVKTPGRLVAPLQEAWAAGATFAHGKTVEIRSPW